MLAKLRRLKCRSGSSYLPNVAMLKRMIPRCDEEEEEAEDEEEHHGSLEHWADTQPLSPESETHAGLL